MWALDVISKRAAVRVDVDFPKVDLCWSWISHWGNVTAASEERIITESEPCLCVCVLGGLI